MNAFFSRLTRSVSICFHPSAAEFALKNKYSAFSAAFVGKTAFSLSSKPDYDVNF